MAERARPKRTAPHPNTTIIPHAGPTGHPACPGWSNARGTQQCLHPPSSPWCLPTSSRFPCYCRQHGPQHTPEAESVSTCPGVRVRSRAPLSRRTPTAQDYENSPGPIAAASPHPTSAPTPTPSLTFTFTPTPKATDSPWTMVAALDPDTAVQGADSGPRGDVPRGPGRPALQGDDGEC